MARRTLPLLAALVLACGGYTSTSGDAGTPPTPRLLDCVWAASESNCWKQTIQAAGACLPPDTEVGVFSADMKTCTFTGGGTVTFDPPATIPPPEAGLGFTVTSGAGECVARTAVAAGRLKIRTSAGTVEQSSPGQELLVTCPDGSRFSTVNVVGLTECSGVTSLDYVPGDLWTWSGSRLSYALTNWPGNGVQTVFTCER